MLANRLIGLARSVGGPFSPTDISGLLRWYEADVLGLSDGTAVSSWTDQSANADHAVQATSTLQPIYKVGVANGHDAIRFDGSNDYMQFSELFDSGSSVGHIFIVTSPSSTARQAILGTRDTTSKGWQIEHLPDTSSVNYYHSGISGSASYSITHGLNVLEIQKDGLDITAGANGALGTPVTLSGYNASTVNLTLIGKPSSFSNYFSGDIPEIIIYDHILGSSDRSSIITYLTDRY